MFFVNKDLCEHLNKHLEVYDILKLRQSFKNNFKILDSHNFERTIKFGSKYYMNKMDKYNINIKIYDTYKIINDNDLELISLYDKINIEIIVPHNRRYTNWFISDNHNLLELIKNLLNNNKINILFIDINIFYVLCNYFKSQTNSFNLTTLHIKMGSCYDKFLYWDLTLHNLKECLKYFQNVDNLIFSNVRVCLTYLNLLKKYNMINSIEFLENIDNDYLKKNDIKLKLLINSFGINKQNINYNLYFDCEDDLFTNRHSIRI